MASCQGAVGHADPRGTGKSWDGLPSHLPMLHCQGQPLRFRPQSTSTATKPLCSSKLPYLPHVYLSQRLATLLCLWSWTIPFLLCLPMEPRLFVISLPLNIFPPSPWKMPALAGAATLTLLRHQGRHHSAGKKALGSRGQTAALPWEEEQLALQLAASCGIKYSLECRYGIQSRYLQCELVPVEKLHSYQIEHNL